MSTLLRTLWGVLVVVSITLVGAADDAALTAPLNIPLSTHVLNLTLNGATTGWPTTSNDLARLNDAVTETVCGQLPQTVNACAAFLMVASPNVLGLQVSVQTAQSHDSLVAYSTLYGWANSSVTPPVTELQTKCAAVLGVTLSPLQAEGGHYLMPCRNDGVYKFLPVCKENEVPNSVVYIGNATGSDLQAYFRTRICGDTPACSQVTITVTPAASLDAYTIVNITGAGNALEAILTYVADVRAVYARATGVTVPPSGAGNPDAGVSATAVQMRYRGTVAQFFSTMENDRYGGQYQATQVCAASTGFWAFALIAIAPCLLIGARYVWYRGRHRSKKRQRALIIEDEKRIMQQYANPGMEGDGTGAGGAEGGYGGDGQDGYDAGYGQGVEGNPPPGTDYQRMFSQDASNGGGGRPGTVWVMDSDGNYYEVPADQYAAQAEEAAAYEGADDAYATDDAAQQQGEEVAVDEVPATNESEGYANGGTVEEAADGAEGGEAAAETYYQTYVDPETGETYQYEQPVQQAVEGYDEGAVEEGQEGVAEDGGGQLQTYVDPETGDVYQYDPNATEPGEYQTYVDPGTGEMYQYDPNAEQAAE